MAVITETYIDVEKKTETSKDNMANMANLIEAELKKELHKKIIVNGNEDNPNAIHIKYDKIPTSTFFFYAISPMYGREYTPARKNQRFHYDSKEDHIY